MTHGINLDHLDTFVDIVDGGSFTAAAARRGLTQPAVSSQMRELERRLGVVLFERVGRRVTPTAAGVELIGYAHQIQSAVGSAVDGMAKHVAAGTGRVRLGTGATACIHLLPPVLRHLRQRFPKLEIIVRTGNTEEIRSAVEDNLLDLGLVTLPAAGRCLETRSVMKDDLVAIVPKSLDVPRELSPPWLAEQGLILYEPGGTTSQIVAEWFRRAGVAPRPLMQLGSVEAMKKLVGAGLGVAIIPAMAAGRRAHSALRNARAPFVVHSLVPPLLRELGIIIRRDKVLSHALRETMRALLQLAPHRR